MQKSRTSQPIFSVGYLVSHLSAVTALRPGDITFTGTPAGVGMARTPRRYLRPGGQVVSRIEGAGNHRPGRDRRKLSR
jgi:2-keto-4-pentenoate hydratase/2-oxohepta-3-ene-1,7-dioic acid hydratase in catechol pathway